MRCIIVLTYLLIAIPAFGQDSPSFDCTKAASAAEKLVCEDADLAKFDRLVAERYAAALASIRKLETGAKEAKNQLRAYQLGWI